MLFGWIDVVVQPGLLVFAASIKGCCIARDKINIKESPIFIEIHYNGRNIASALTRTTEDVGSN